MRWFGESWGAPLNEDCPQVTAPVGQRCIWCYELILDHETGVIYSNGPAVHKECFFRQSFGSVGHQRGLCICNGGPGTMDDPPDMTKRQAARAAVQEFEAAHPDT
jgi:hypothetical protein